MILNLRFLGRRHDAAQARGAIALAQALFPRISFDLIYARPGQRAEAWLNELAEALAQAGDHLSLYQLTIEAETPFGAAFRRGELEPMPGDEAAALYELTQQYMESVGFPAYEISNYARPGSESRHNLTYWRYGDYVGVGPGAHGRLTIGGEKRAFRQHRAPEAWLNAVERHGHATRTDLAITPEERFAEMAMMGLRLQRRTSPFARHRGNRRRAGRLDRHNRARSPGRGRILDGGRGTAGCDRCGPSAARFRAGGAPGLTVRNRTARTSSAPGRSPPGRRAAPPGRRARAARRHPPSTGRSRQCPSIRSPG